MPDSVIGAQDTVKIPKIDHFLWWDKYLTEVFSQAGPLKEKMEIAWREYKGQRILPTAKS